MVVGFAAYLAASQASWPAAIILIAAMWIDGGHEHRPHPPARIAAIAGAFVVIAVAVFTFPTDIAVASSWAATSVFVLGIVAAWIGVRRLRQPVSTGDRDRQPLSHSRIAQARLVAGVAIGLAAILTPADPAAYGPVLAATIAIAATSLRKAASDPAPAPSAAPS